MSKPRVGFLYTMEAGLLWEDGLYEALRLLEKDFEVLRVNLQGVNLREPVRLPRAECYLAWSGFGGLPDQVVRKVAGKKGLLVAGNLVPPIKPEEYDVLFYETEWYRAQLGDHPNLIHAFGVNTKVFRKPKEKMSKYWDYIGAGAYANWKRWEKMTEKEGRRLVVGQYQEQNEVESGAIVSELVKGGVMVMGQVPPRELAQLMYLSHTAYVPSLVYGGGERFLLEARACGLVVEIEEDNPKLHELLTSPIYDEMYYAKQLKKGIESII